MVLTKEKGTLAFDVLAPQAPTLPANIPALGDTIYLNYTYGATTNKLFGGTVVTVETINDGGKLIRYKITCQDWGYTFDSKLVKKTYVQMDPADIIADLVANFVPAGFTTNNVQRGNFLVASIKFNYEHPVRCLESLANQIGWDWYIDPDKDVHFFFAGNDDTTTEDFPAPISIDDTSGQILWPTLDVTADLSNLKNSIYVIGGTYTKLFADPAVPGMSYAPVDIYTSVAGTFVYPLAYPYDLSTMVVTLDGVVQTLGTDQQTDPTSVQVLYNNTGVFVRFTTDPGAGHTIEVTGQARIPILAHVTNSASIAAYGEYQDSIIDQQIKSIGEAQERAFADITQFGTPIYDVKFDTIDPLSVGIYVGQSIQLSSTIYGATKSLVIKRIEARCYTPGLLTFSVEALGTDIVTFNDIMLYLLQQNNAQMETSDNAVLQVFVDGASEDLALADIVAATSVANIYAWDDYPNAGINSPFRWGFSTWN